MTAIRLDHLVKTFGTAKAVDDVCLTIKEGTLTVLLGPSGCGKSTCLRLIAGLESADDGAVRIGSEDVTHHDPAVRGIAMVFQSYALFPHLNVAENIIFGLRVRKEPKVMRDEKLRKVAELVGLSDYLDRRPSQLSGGQRQRVALARAIISEKKICLMDEPLSNLDAKLRHEMRVEIRALQQRLHMTMVYVTHDQTEAMTMADRIVLMRQGKIEQEGTPSELYGEPASAFVAGFIGSPPMNVFASTENKSLIGIRPEHVRLASTADIHHDDQTTRQLSGTIDSIEYLGAESVVSIKSDTAKLAARLSGPPLFFIGQPVRALWNGEDEFAFDSKTGLRLYPDLYPPLQPKER